MLSFAIVIHSLKPAITPQPNQMWLQSHRTAWHCGLTGAGDHLSTAPVIRPDWLCAAVPLELSFLYCVNEMDLFFGRCDGLIGAHGALFVIIRHGRAELCACQALQTPQQQFAFFSLSPSFGSPASHFLRAQVYQLVLRASWFTGSDEDVLLYLCVRNSLQPSSVFLPLLFTFYALQKEREQRAPWTKSFRSVWLVWV